MRLEASPIKDTNIGVHRIHSQQESFQLELKSLNKGKEAQPEVSAEVWCLKYKGHDHDKDHCLFYHNYPMGVGPVPLKPKNITGMSAEAAPWCAICQVTRQHMKYNYHLLQKFVQTPQ